MRVYPRGTPHRGTGMGVLSVLYANKLIAKFLSTSYIHGYSTASLHYWSMQRNDIHIHTCLKYPVDYTSYSDFSMNGKTKISNNYL